MVSIHPFHTSSLFAFEPLSLGQIANWSNLYSCCHGELQRRINLQRKVCWACVWVDTKQRHQGDQGSHSWGGGVHGKEQKWCIDWFSWAFTVRESVCGEISPYKELGLMSLENMDPYSLLAYQLLNYPAQITLLRLVTSKVTNQPVRHSKK